MKILYARFTNAEFLIVPGERPRYFKISYCCANLSSCDCLSGTLALLRFTVALCWSLDT